MPELYYSSMSGQDILSAEGVYKDENGTQISQEQDSAARRSALEAKLVSQDGARTEAEILYQSLSNVNSEWKDYDLLVKAAVSDSKAAEQKFSELS
jgi:hypothetical protein